MTISVERIGGGTLPTRWTPTIGRVTREFIDRKLSQRGAPTKEAMDSVLAEATQILGRCLPPSDDVGKEAGLVVGYVQSGKTLSFTTVSALAHDNNYGIVILLTGVAVNLKAQSERRLEIDLGLEDIQHDWMHIENPESTRHASDFEKFLRSWKANRLNPRGRTRKSLLITVLKHHKRLQDLEKVLSKLNLNGIPALIIDDESDQASLNTKASKNLKNGTDDKSTTYDKILALKAVIPHHTYLQYTATPQANLLIGIADVLSPSFAELVTPGDGYVGGKSFFDNNSKLCLPIPLSEVPSKDNDIKEPPLTLQEALRFYLLGIAHHFLLGQKGNRSMMIHPSQNTGPHTDYKKWADDLIQHWGIFLQTDKLNPARMLLESEFKETHAELIKTYPNLTSADELIAELPSVMDELCVVKVNSKSDGEKSVQWNKRSYWILVGGQKLDRGFTVEGLTVTYMPRTASSNADTLQQRARFFGYKRTYEGLCRVFLLPDVISAFRHYADSEEFIRKALEEHRGEPLKEWKRDFILHRSLSPTRPSIIGRNVEKVELDEDWVTPGALFKDKEAVKNNLIYFQNKVNEWKEQHNHINAGNYPEFRDIRNDSPPNILIEAIPLSEVLNFLVDIAVPDLDDSLKTSAAAIALARFVNEHKDAVADVFLIGDLSTKGLTGRSLNVKQRINELFVGHSPQSAKKIEDMNYVGDRRLFTPDRVTLHLRYLKFKPSVHIAVEIADCVPWFALRLPASIAKDCVIEKV